MANIFVRTTGDDTLGTGTILAPYRTVGKAMSVWNDYDTIDVGSGDFPETLVWNPGVVAEGVIRGKGYRKTRILAQQVSSYMLDFGNSISRLLIQDLTIEQQALGMVIIRKDDTVTNGRYILARVLIQLIDGYAISSANTSEDGSRIDLLNCVIKGYDPQNRQGLGIRVQIANTVVARNTVFADLREVVSDEGGGTLQNINYCVLYNNEREVLVGSMGLQSFRVTNPQFRNYRNNDLAISPTSPLRNAGVDLNSGYDQPLRTPPTELNWLFNGKAPDLGLEETVFPQGSAIGANFNFHLLLQVFAEQFENVLQDFDTIRRNRTLALADSKAMSLRFGAFLGAYRPADMEEEEYREFLVETIDLILNNAPAYKATERIIQKLFPGSAAFKREYHNTRRFPLTSSLKLKVVTPTPSLDVHVAAGYFQLERQWYRVIDQDVSFPSVATRYLYAAANETSPDDVQATLHITADAAVRRGFRLDVLTGIATFTEGSNKVLGVGTLFTTEIVRELRRIQASPFGFFHQVESIESDTELTLRDPFDEITVTVQPKLVRPVRYLGKVVTDATTVTDIEQEGILGGSDYLNTRDTKGHGYDLVIDDVNVFDTVNDRVPLMLLLLCKVKSLHKLGFVFQIDDYFEGVPPRGLLICRQEVPFTQSNVTYTEDWESSSWPVY